MNQSEQINELAAAVAKAQGRMEPAVFNKTNPHFKSRFADFTSCMDACRKPLSENGLAVMQYCETREGELNLVTMIAHSSGQWMKSYLPIYPADKKSQTIGAAITYAKRYGLSAMLGIVADDDDDDGESAQGRSATNTQQAKVVTNPQQFSVNKPKEEPKPTVPTLSIEQIKDITTLLGDDLEKMNRILSAYQVKSLADIPVSLYEIIIKRLQIGAKA